MKISVLTPSYNSAAFIEKSIQSVLDQQFSDFEHIVVDGKSTDGTVEILKKYPHLKWISEKDKGQSDAMNKAFAMSSGELIVYLNADDYFEPEVFGFVADYFKETPACDVLVGNLVNRFINSEREFITRPSVAFNEILRPYRYGFPYNPVSYFYKREVQEKIGPFPMDEHYAMDYYFILRAFRLFRVHKVEKVFGCFFRTGDNKTSNNADTGLMINAMAKKYAKSLGVKPYLHFKLSKLLYSASAPIRNYKVPVKWAFYMLYGRKQFSSFEEFQRTGYKQFKQKRAIQE